MCHQFVQENEKQSDIEMTKSHLYYFDSETASSE